MKSLIALLWVIAIFNSGCASKAKVESDGPVPQWEFALTSAPESVFYDEVADLIFVSNISGAPTEKDGVGWIAKLDGTGKALSEKWATGFNAPKGMRSHDGILWVTDIDEIFGVQISTGKISKRIKVAGAKFLNDLAIDVQGNLYVSDILTNKIHKIRSGRVEIFMEGKELESPNGLLVVNNKLMVACWGAEMKDDWSTKTPGSLIEIDLKTKKIKVVSAQLGNLDGLEIDAAGNFLVSDWAAGKVFRVAAQSGKADMILKGFKGAADIGIHGPSQVIVVPRMGENKISAYKLSNL